MSLSSSVQPEVVLPTREAQTARASTLSAEGKKALAVGEWEVAVEKYADALELMRALHGELSTELAPLLLPYGKALFEVACKQTGVLGKADEEAGEPEEKGETSTSTEFTLTLPDSHFSTAPVGKAAQFSFEGDDDDDEEQADDAEGEGQAEGEGDDDDFTVAWEVLDLARTLFEKQGTATAAKDLGETYAVLGDVSLETENFPQAVEDYTSALKTFHQCLPLTSREVASSHYKLAIVLESLSDRKQEAIENVEKAIESVQARKAAIERGQDPDHLEDSHDVGGHNLRAHSKGKGRAVANENYKSSDLTMEERKKQVEDCEEQLRDLLAKLEDLKTAPESQGIVEDTIAHLLGNTADASGTAGQAINDAAGKVNDLTSMVKKKARKTADKVVPSADEQVVGQASSLQDQVVDQAAVIRDQVAGQASAITDQVVDQASTLKDQALDQASSLKDQAIDQASTTAESLREKLVDGAQVAADTLKDKAEGVLAQAQHTVDDLMKKGTTQAAHAIDAIKAAANGIVQEIMDEGKEITQESVEAVQGVIEDVRDGREKVAHVAEDLAHAAQETAHAGLDAAKHAGEAVVQEIMEEGQEVTREVVEDVVGAAEDVLGGVEAIGREGKRKVEELKPEEVEEVSKKQRTE
ncbi:hypothetical protein QFC20_005619 [Naganishia adeliensis]|uniref:Uncharacterized protein n=1 Tax=Naganishia adeliensis TaxID=92952 RepID=A0ACC2VLA9_9TREE|nr:hypothetical protein QFC20_005619 [Naganishia adeliensis]